MINIIDLLNNENNSDYILEKSWEYFNNENKDDRSVVVSFLDYTSKPQFLKGLSSDKKIEEWAELSYKLIRDYNYSLNDLITARTEEDPNHILFQDMSDNNLGRWTYKRIAYYLKEIAASFYHVVNQKINETNKISVKPKVAILCENSVVSACCDLACLSYDIFVTPLNVSFNRDILEYIFDLLDINIVISDDKGRIDTLVSIRNSKKSDLKIFATSPDLIEYSDEVHFLGEYETRFNSTEIDSILAKREMLNVNQVCTVMFTSGSTGMPKGLSFTMYNLITKRFARAAALPDIGDREVFLCYLPLYHTFGRYLEMLGTIYWRATYVFAGNTSADTLLNLFPKVEPSVFISIPLRWNQLYEKANELMSEATSQEEIHKIFRSVVGSRLKFGLSAAGYLDPKVFIFFSRNGVELCSGFGMTEATGGITMTPPGAYKEGTVGKPLPGVKTLINSEDVLEIGGHYIARYLESAPPYSKIPYPDEEEFYISTGDVFRCDDEGYYEIIDRVKDIYKNNKGQTVSPKNVEIKFEGVPGIKRTFLVGDGRPYNTLLIVPDNNDEIIMSKPVDELNDYFNLIILKANQELVPYERVVNYKLLDRDFAREMGELTAKDSYNRKTIEKNFAKEIEILYERNHIDFNFDKYTIRLPRWIYRDLGILETDIIMTNSHILNLSNKSKLRIKKCDNENQIMIGDLIYEITSKIINIGTIARQPKLWAGNPNLINFLPIKEGWDTYFEGISENVFIPYQPNSKDYLEKGNSITHKINRTLIELNGLFCDTFFGEIEIAKSSLSKLEKELENNNERNINLIRKRLQSLARHPNEEMRCEAYRILLLDEPSPDYSKAFPAFIKSGLSYLNETTIKKIASGKLEIRRLEALRKRLLAYRTVIELNDDEITVQQFSNLFKLLLDFLKHNPEFYTSVRYELISWMLYDRIPKISKIAADYFTEMHKFYEKMLDETTIKYPIELWESKLVFDDGISNFEKNAIKSVLVNKAFLKQSVLLCFDENDFSINDVKDRSAWISRLNSDGSILNYRIVITMKNQRRYDLQFYINIEGNEKDILQTTLRHVAISGYPYGYRALAKLGAYRQELRAWSFEYFGELSLWSKIREFSSQRISGSEFNKIESLRKYFIQGMAALFTGWRNSGKQILPGILSPNNVIIPELDFRDGALINSINGWQKYEKPIQILDAFIRNFYDRSIIHYPWLEAILDKTWIFQSCVDALDLEEGKQFLQQLLDDLNQIDNKYSEINQKLQIFINNLNNQYYIPLKIVNAIERYNDWLSTNYEATHEAKEQTIRELISLYNLNIKNESDRFYLYQRTYFKDSTPEIQEQFDKIINRLYRNKTEKATQLIELTELQSMINNGDDRLVFTRMLFPRVATQDIKLVRSGSSNIGKTIIKSFIKDISGDIYTFREPSNVSEIGNLYRIFFKENYPKVLSELDEHYILTDNIERIIGGLCYRKVDASSVLIDGGIIISAMSNRGLGTAMLEDFCSRMASQGIESVKAHFFLKNFYLKRGFKFDKSHGTLVRFLNTAVPSEIKGNYCMIG